MEMVPYLRRIQIALAERGVKAALPTGTDPHIDAVPIVKAYGLGLYHRKLEDHGFGAYADRPGKLRTLLQSAANGENAEALAALHALESYEHADVVLARNDVALGARLVALIEPSSYAEHLLEIYRRLDALV